MFSHDVAHIVLFYLQVIVLFAGINDVLDGWSWDTVIRRYQRFFNHQRSKNPSAQVGISGILPILPNRWVNTVPTKKELEEVEEFNKTVKTVNWRLAELATVTRKFRLVITKS